MRVDWTGPAKADLEELIVYISRDNRSAAFRQADRIMRASVRLERHPNIGRVGPLAATRELVVSGTPCPVIYRLLSDSVEILRVIHGRRPGRPEGAE